MAIWWSISIPYLIAFEVIVSVFWPRISYEVHIGYPLSIGFWVELYLGLGWVVARLVLMQSVKWTIPDTLRFISAATFCGIGVLLVFWPAQLFGFFGPTI
jgi:hypothetical protein